MPRRPAPVPHYEPVTPEQAAGNRALLDAEVAAYERRWASGRGGRERHLRALPSAAPAPGEDIPA